MPPARTPPCLHTGMLRAVADAGGALGKNVLLSHGASKIGRKEVAGSNDLKTKVSREQLIVTFSSEDKTCSVTRIGGQRSHLIRADGGEVVVISKNATHDVRPGDQLWIMVQTGGVNHGGYVFEPTAGVAPPALPAPPVVPASPAAPAPVPTSPAAPAPLAPIAAENSADTPAWQKHMLGGDSVPAAGTDASGGGGRGSGGRGSGGGGGGGGRGRDTCHHCQKIGHWASECPERGGKGSGSRGGGGGGECYNCGKTGHYARDCKAPRKDSAAAAAKAKKAMDEEAIALAAAAAEETKRAQAEAKAAARAEAEEVAVKEEREKREAMEAEGHSLNCVRAVVVPRREHVSEGRGPVPPAGAGERLACVRLRLADGRLHAEACDGVELLVGEAQRCSWTALPVGSDLVGELHDDRFDINRRVLRLQASGCGLQAAGVAAAEEVTLALWPRTAADAAAAADPTVGGAMLLELIELGARLRPHVRGVRARNDSDAAALAAREKALAEEAEEVRRIEEEELAAFLPLLRAKKRRLAERQAEVVAKGIVVLGEGSSPGDGSIQHGSIQHGSRAEQPGEEPALQRPPPLKD